MKGDELTPAPDDRELWKIIAELPWHDKDAATPTPPNRHTKKLSRKELRRTTPRWRETAVDSEIDLHNCTAEEAEFKLFSEIELGKKQGWKSIRVIHGGSPGKYGPVQNAVERMAKSVLSKSISHYKLEEFNSGATILYLQSVDPETPPPQSGKKL